MNKQYLGDALDHWKGSVFERLAKCLNNLHVDPMAGDADKWKHQDRRLYADLLHIQLNNIIVHRSSLADGSKRSSYFKELPHSGDLFLDPDIGLKTGRVKEPYKYLFPEELSDLLKVDEKSVVIVYQHVRGKKTRDRVKRIFEVMQLCEQKFYCASYESGTVALLFFSMNRVRIKTIVDLFMLFLGSHAKNRIGRCTKIKRN